jgi:hypothetical protein
MSVSRAYITSLWTTGILVASSLLVLALTSAIVAFDRWPGNAAGAPVDRLTVAAPAPRPVVTSAAGAGRSAASARAEAARAGSNASHPVGAPSAPRDQTITSSPQRGSSVSSHTTLTTTSKPTPRTTSAPKSDPGPGAPVRDVGNTVGGQLDPVSPQAGGLAAETANSGADALDAVVPPRG